jgi:hypothetical protein
LKKLQRDTRLLSPRPADENEADAPASAVEDALEITHQIKHEKDDEDESQSAAAADRTAKGVTAAAEKKQQNNDDDNEVHAGSLAFGSESATN